MYAHICDNLFVSLLPFYFVDIVLCFAIFQQHESLNYAIIKLILFEHNKDKHNLLKLLINLI